MVIKLRERVDKSALQAILADPEKYGLGSVYINGVKQSDQAGVVTLYRKYLASLDERGYVDVAYKQHGRAGRHWPTQVCLTSMCKKVRHAIGARYHIDLDVVNCHPTLLEQIFVRLGVECPLLEKYNSERAQFYGLKSRVIEVLNGSPVRAGDHELVLGIAGEVAHSQPRFVEEFKSFYNKAKRTKRDNVFGRTVAAVLQNEENRCLMAMVDALAKFNITPTTLAYDGLTIPRTRENVDDLPALTQAISDAVRTVTQYNIQITEKPMNQGHAVAGRSKKSPLRMLQPRAEPEQKQCGCLPLHAMTQMALEIGADADDIDEFNQQFHGLARAALSVCDARCAMVVLAPLLNRVPDFDHEEMEEYIERAERFDPHEALRFLADTCSRADPRGNRAKRHFARLAREHAMPLEPVTDAPFEAGADLHDFITDLRSRVFDSRDALVEYFVHNVGRYVKFVNQPELFVTASTIGGRLEMNLTTSISAQSAHLTRPAPDAPPDPYPKYVQVFSGMHSIYGDLSVRARLPLYRRVTFEPRGCDPRDFNMFTGFAATYIPNPNVELIQPILDHIRTCWADDDEDIFDYFLQWFRAAFKHPGMKTQVVPILYGLEGTGKGILLDHLIIPHVYGPGTATACQGLASITQRFNSVIMNKLFICVNEVSSESNNFHNTFEKLKALITDSTVQIERKGIDTFAAYPNKLNMIFTTNNLDSVKMGKSDRRYLCVETSARYKGNFDYFKQLLDACTAETGSHFYSYIINLPRTRDVRNIPKTQLKAFMSIHNRNSCELFLSDVIEYVQENGLPATMSPIDAHVADRCHWSELLTEGAFHSRYVSVQALSRAYRTWCGARDEKRKSQKELVRTFEMAGYESTRPMVHGKRTRSIVLIAEAESD